MTPTRIEKDDEGQPPLIQGVLSRFSRTLRRVLRLLEKALTFHRSLAGPSSTRPLVVSTLSLPECTYVVARIPTAYLEKLSARQSQLLTLILREVPRKTIAYRLGISPKTVDTQIDRLLKHCGSCSILELVRRLGILAETDGCLDALLSPREELNPAGRAHRIRR